MLLLVRHLSRTLFLVLSLLVTATATAAVTITLPLAVGGELIDDDLDGTFDRQFPGSTFTVGGSVFGVAGTFHARGALEYDLLSPALSAYSVDAVSNVTLRLAPRLVGSTGGAPRLTGLVLGYVGDGVFDFADANEGVSTLGTFTVYTAAGPFPLPTPIFDLTTYVKNEMTAGTRFLGFNFRVQELPPPPASTHETFTAILTFTVPEPAALTLLALGAVLVRRKHHSTLASVHS